VPKWALVPEGAKLTVRAGYEPAPGHVAVGYGEIDAKAPPRETEQSYEAALRDAGWTVQAGRFDATYPEIPPRPLHWCIVQARRSAHVLQMSVDMDEAETVGRLHWTDGKMPWPTGAKTGGLGGMSNPNSFWNPLDIIVELFTREGRENLARFLLWLLVGAAILIGATYMLTGRGPLSVVGW